MGDILVTCIRHGQNYMGKTFILLYDTFAPTKLIERFSLFSVMQMFYFLKLRSIHIIPTLSRDLMWESKKKALKIWVL